MNVAKIDSAFQQASQDLGNLCTQFFDDQKGVPLTKFAMNAFANQLDLVLRKLRKEFENE